MCCATLSINEHVWVSKIYSYSNFTLLPRTSDVHSDPSTTLPLCLLCLWHKLASAKITLTQSALVVHQAACDLQGCNANIAQHAIRMPIARSECQSAVCVLHRGITVAKWPGESRRNANGPRHALPLPMQGKSVEVQLCAAQIGYSSKMVRPKPGDHAVRLWIGCLARILRTRCLQLLSRTPVLALQDMLLPCSYVTSLALA